MSKKEVLKLIGRLLLSIILVMIVITIIFGIIVWFIQDKVLFYPSHDEDGYNELLK